MRVAAVDMGATSVRVAVIELEAEMPRLEIVHRWQHSPETRPDGSVRWRWTELLENVRLGLDRALETGPVHSIGVDGWAVDYGLLDAYTETEEIAAALELAAADIDRLVEA